MPGLMANGSNRPFAEHMFDFAELNQRIGTPGLLAEGKRYDGAE